MFKPGTIEQIRSVIRTEVPTEPVIMHVETRAPAGTILGGSRRPAAGFYSELRSRANITVCVGGGIGTPEGLRNVVRRWAQATASH